MAIDITIPTIRDYPKLGDTHNVFRQKADIAWTDLSNLIPVANKWSAQVNTTKNEMESFKNSAYSYMNTTLGYRNDANNYQSLAYGYKVAAEDAANRAEAVVIPTETTYSLNDLESALNSLLTYQVAQAAQISILKQGA